MTLQDDHTQQAPACFGSISCFSRDSEFCQKCPAYQSCEAQSYATLQSIKNVVNVDDLIREHEKARRQKQAQRDAERLAMNKAKAEQPKASQPKRQEIAERATKVEKVTFEVSKDDEKFVMTLPVKAQPFALGLIKSGMVVDIRQGLSNGVNAIAEKKPKWLSLCVELLLSGSYSRKDLKQHFIDHFGWSDATAASHVSLAFVLLTGFKIAQEIDSKLVAMPS